MSMPRLLHVAVSGLVGSACGFFAFRNEERKKYEHEMELNGYRLVTHYHPPTLPPGVVTGASSGWVSYSWEKGTGDKVEEQAYDKRHRPFRL